MTTPAARVVSELVDLASGSYRSAGRSAYHFARGKLRRDPVFAALLARGLLGRRDHILDLGCGRGLLAAWLLAARQRAILAAWPEDWPAAPRPNSVRGIDTMQSDVEAARAALGDQAAFTVDDVRTADFGRADGIVILDVLHYIEYPAQRDVLERARRALTPGGVLLLRVGDAAGGRGFTVAKWVDRMVLLSRGQGLRRLHCRSGAEWHRLLEADGFDCEALPMSAGTPFSNILFVARPR